MSAAERLRKLAALAGSDNDFEANEAARQACRIIREGKVVISDTPPARDPRSDHGAPRGWRADPWAAPRPPPPSARPVRPPPRGPFARRPSVYGVECAACSEEIPLGEAFACADGHVHGDCVPPAERP